MKIRIVLLWLILSNIMAWAESKPILIEKGELDLTGWNTEAEPVVPLNGEWKFYWEQLLQLKDLSAVQNYAYAQLSVPWNEQSIGGQTLPKNGYATYVLSIKLPPHIQSVSFSVPAVFNSYAFWVNDKLICSSGKVGTSKESMIPQWQPKTVRVDVSSSTLVVLFQIANFQDTRGGCAEVMRIGSTSYLTWLDNTFHISGIVLIAFFILVAIGAIVIYYINGTASFVNLSLLCLAFAVRFLFSDLYFAYDLGVQFPWLISAKIEYITIPAIIITAALFISSIYPREFKSGILNFVLIACAGFIIGVLFVPSAILSPLLIVLQVAGLLFSLYTLYVMVRALMSQRSGAWVSALSVGTFALVGFYNIYAFIVVLDLNRTIIHIGYAIALILSVISLVYRTPVRLRSEEHDILRYDDLFNTNGQTK